MFTYYDAKPYHLFVLFYGGGHKFSLEIFNVYGLEICYSVEEDSYPDKEVKPLEAVWMNDCYYLSNDFEVDKLHGQFSFNCYNSASGHHELIIEKQHLQAKIYIIRYNHRIICIVLRPLRTNLRKLNIIHIHYLYT